MIYGVGVDIVKISRIKRLMQDTDFIKRFYTDAEAEYIGKKENTAAAFYAAKEAYAKALGTGFRAFGLKDVEILHDSQGKPYIKTYKNARRDGCNIQLSLSHDGDYAIAYVIIESGE